MMVSRVIGMTFIVPVRACVRACVRVVDFKLRSDVTRAGTSVWCSRSPMAFCLE